MSNIVTYKDETPVAELAKHFVQSGYFADTRQLSQAIVKILAGRELGIGPMAAMQGINIISGRTTASAGLIASLIKRSSKYNYKVVEMSDKRVTIEFFEEKEKVGNSSFTIEDAKIANLLAKDVWKKYPKNMLFARAISNGARWYCPDIFSGSVYVPEELESNDITANDLAGVGEYVEANFTVTEIVEVELTEEEKQRKEEAKRLYEELGPKKAAEKLEITKAELMKRIM